MKIEIHLNYELTLNKTRTSWERLRKVANVIIYGTNTKAGRFFDLMLLGIILLSVIIVMMETVHDFDERYHKAILIIEWSITVFFTIEYILRILAVDRPFKYILSFYGIIDLLAVLPMYLSLVASGASVLAIIRAFRLIRLFKILNHRQFTGQSIHLKDALYASRGKIFVFLYFVLVSTVFIGSVMYVIEGPENGFTSIPTSIYWTIVTLTTVGYGDISPQTFLGQFFASFVMILGYGIIAVPTGIVTAELAKSTSKDDESIRQLPCIHCGEEGHKKGSKYCYKCGGEL
ncbi:MAG: ion transporter [Lachnospirales bacterium]